MGKEDIGMEPEDHDETLKQVEDVASSTDNEGKDAKNIHKETEEEEKTLEELKEENKLLSDKMMRALAETENIRKKFFKEKKRCRNIWRHEIS